MLTPDFLARLEQLEIISRKIFQGRTKGERLSKRKGQSVEFADFRNYVIGDDLRFLDWNLYARMDRLFLRLYQEEEDLRFYVLVDNSLSMSFGEPSKLHYAKQVAAALTFIALTNQDRVVLEVVNENLISTLPPLRGRHSFHRVLDFLKELEPAGTGDLTRSLKTFSIKHRGKGVVVLISDLMDKGGIEDALRFLIARQMDIYVLQILSQEEIEPDLRGDLKMVDAEDGDETEITMSGALLHRYKQTLDAFRGHIHQFCSKRGISYLFTSNQVPFERLILTYFRQRGLLR